MLEALHVSPSLSNGLLGALWSNHSTSVAFMGFTSAAFGVVALRALQQTLVEAWTESLKESSGFVSNILPRNPGT